MITNDATLLKVKHEVLYEVAKLAYEGRLDDERDNLPYKMVPGPQPFFRCCIYREREVIRQRIRLAEGKAPGTEDDGNVVQIINSACNIAGPALGALAITTLAMPVVLMLDVIGAVLACTSLAFVKIPNPPPSELAEKNNILQDLKEAQREVVSHRGMSLLLILSIMATFFIMPVSVLFPLMTLNHFSGDAFQMSLIEAIWGVGSLLGGVTLSIRQYKINKITLINLTYILLGTGFTASGLLSPNAFVWFVVFTAFEGIIGSIYFASFTAIIQTKINPSILGRVFSIYMSLNMLPAMFGLMSTGFLADHVGITNTFVIGGFVVLAIGVVSFCIPSLLQVGKLTIGKNTRNI